ncbi:ATP-grasp domain-containing protein [bacterium]|nr:ATP-grasp domain-containing protein [bacterium]MDA7913354.1 ATP-grasp domain-containing protein [bacterium]MDB4555604.1 ATP-grasp domain-containing protein [bacterium]
MDVGLIRGRGWAVVECNECWASGIYACDPTRVLETLVSAAVKSDTMKTSPWDFRKHYTNACPNSAG